VIYRGSAIVKPIAENPAKKKKEKPFNLTYWREAKIKVKKEIRERKEERRNRAELNLYLFVDYK